MVIFDRLIPPRERAHPVAYKEDMAPTERRRWNSRDDRMRQWCRRDNLHSALPLRGADRGFQARIRRVSHEGRGMLLPCTH